LCMFLAQAKVDSKGVIASVLAFLVMFIAYGERKYIISPALVCVAAYHYRVRKLPILVTVVTGTAFYLIFEYVGYLRGVTDGGLHDGAASVLDFFQYLPSHIGEGELANLYGTASAAYHGFIQALPDFGDYLSAWRLAIPQFLVTLDYVPTDYRFAQAYAPQRALDEKMGWGF